MVSRRATTVVTTPHQIDPSAVRRLGVAPRDPLRPAQIRSRHDHGGRSAWKRGLGAWIVSPIRGVLRGMNELLDTVRAPILLAATVATGLQAGTYYTWACGVMPGLARANRTLVATMQSVNTAIVNPVFMLTFIGAPLLAGVAAATSVQTARPWVVAGLALAVSTVVITGSATSHSTTRSTPRAWSTGSSI